MKTLKNLIKKINKMEVIGIIAIIISSIALLIGIINIFFKQTQIEKQIIVNDQMIKMNDNIISVQGLKTSKIIHGNSELNNGEFTNLNNIESKQFTDGIMTIKNGNMTDLKEIETDFLKVQKGLNIPASNYGTVHITQMNKIEFNNIWETIDNTTKNNKLFFTLDQKGDNITTINNSIQLHKLGQWQYNFSCVIKVEDDVSIGMTCSENEPNLPAGFTSFYKSSQHKENFTVINGSGIIHVQDTDSLHKIWVSHISMLGENTDLTITQGILNFNWIGY
jgi:hypothetical protein